MMINENIKNRLPDHPFWKFSVKIYTRPKIEQALLKLQNEHHLNVNVVLYCCWYAFTGQGRLSKVEVRQLLTAIHPWHERIVLPMRRMRKKLKSKILVSWVDTLQKMLADYEVEAEHIEQLMLVESLWYEKRPIRNTLQKAADICRNVATYCGVMQIQFDSGDCELMAQVLKEIFPKIDENNLLSFTKHVFMSKGGSVQLSSTQLWLDLD